MHANYSTSALSVMLLSFGPLLLPISAGEPSAKRAEREKKYLSHTKVDVQAAEGYLATTGLKSDSESLLKFLQGLPTEETDRRTLAGLVEQLGSDDFQTREAASRRLTAAGIRRMPVELERAANSKDPEVAKRAKDCREAIYTRNGQIGMARDLLLQRKSVSALQALLKADSTDVRQVAALGLGELGQDAEPAIPDLVKNLQSEDVAVSGAANEALWRIGPGATKTIVGLLDDKRPIIRVRALEAIAWQVRLAYVPDDGKELLPRLIEMMKKEEPKVRRAAPQTVSAIGQEGNKEALTALVEALKFEDKARLDKDELAVPSSAALALLQLDEGAKPAIPALIEAMHDRDNQLAGQAARALGTICRHDADETLVKAITAVLGDKNRGEARGLAAMALGNFGTSAKNAVPALLDALKETDEVLPANCMHAIVEIAPTDEKVINALISELEDTKPAADRRFAAGCLGRIGPPAKAALPALRRAIPGDLTRGDDAQLKIDIDQAIKRISK